MILIFLQKNKNRILSAAVVAGILKTKGFCAVTVSVLKLLYTKVSNKMEYVLSLGSTLLAFPLCIFNYFNAWHSGKPDDILQAWE